MLVWTAASRAAPVVVLDRYHGDHDPDRYCTGRPVRSRPGAVHDRDGAAWPDSNVRLGCEYSTFFFTCVGLDFLVGEVARTYVHTYIQRETQRWLLLRSTE